MSGLTSWLNRTKKFAYGIAVASITNGGKGMFLLFAGGAMLVGWIIIRRKKLMTT